MVQQGSSHKLFLLWYMNINQVQYGILFMIIISTYLRMEAQLTPVSMHNVVTVDYLNSDSSFERTLMEQYAWHKSGGDSVTDIHTHYY